MLKKQTILIDKESGSEWRVDAKTVGQTVPSADPNEKPKPLYVYVLSNKQGHRRFVYEHLMEREFSVKEA